MNSSISSTRTIQLCSRSLANIHDRARSCRLKPILRRPAQTHALTPGSCLASSRSSCIRSPALGTGLRVNPSTQRKAKVPAASDCALWFSGASKEWNGVTDGASTKAPCDPNPLALALLTVEFHQLSHFVKPPGLHKPSETDQSFT